MGSKPRKEPTPRTPSRSGPSTHSPSSASPAARSRASTVGERRKERAWSAPGEAIGRHTLHRDGMIEHCRALHGESASITPPEEATERCMERDGRALSSSAAGRRPRAQQAGRPLGAAGRWLTTVVKRCGEAARHRAQHQAQEALERAERRWSSTVERCTERASAEAIERYTETIERGYLGPSAVRWRVR